MVIGNRLKGIANFRYIPTLIKVSVGGYLDCIYESDLPFGMDVDVQALGRISTAKRDLKTSEEVTNAYERDGYIRRAFDNLFHAARIASMTYLSTEETKWGKVKKKLPHRHKKEFDEIISTLHIEYFYHGNYPKDGLAEDFNNWLKKVENYVRKLEVQVKGRLPP